MPGIELANQFQYEGVVVVTEGQVKVAGAAQAEEVVSEFRSGGVSEVVLDVVARTRAGTGYHLQALGPADLMNTDLIHEMVNGVRITGST